MSKILSPHIFTSESVSEGHPDKVADQVSDAMLDAYLALDPHAHVACETAVGQNLLVNLGEVTCNGGEKIDTESIARAVVRDIGYDRHEEGFSFDTFRYENALHRQSPDINQGVDRGSDEEQGAGDQGMMFGYATRATPELMPAPIVFSHSLLRTFSRLRRSGEIPYLRPDAKAQVSVFHEKGYPVSIDTVVVSHQTTDDVSIEKVRKDIEEVARGVLDPKLLTNRTRFFVNPTGKFVIGGPAGDAGLTGRKIIVDTYGGVGSHGGGAFSGKDASKVDRSAAYYCRYVAKNVVAAGLADKCEVQVSYAIGRAAATSINVSIYTYGTGAMSEERIADIIQNGGMFDFRPGMIVKELGLLAPKGWRYRDTATYGHFGRPEFPWERLDKVKALRAAAGMAV